jgi:hypothetical protein
LGGDIELATKEIDHKESPHVEATIFCSPPQDLVLQRKVFRSRDSEISKCGQNSKELGEMRPLALEIHVSSLYQLGEGVAYIAELSKGPGEDKLKHSKIRGCFESKAKTPYGALETYWISSGALSCPQNTFM